MKTYLYTTTTAIGFSAIGWTVSVTSAFAQVTQYAPNSTFAGNAGLPTTNAVDYAITIGRALFSILGLIALVLIIYGGFLMLTSQGNEEKVKKGRDTLMWAIVGLIVMLSSLGILQYIDAALFTAAASE